jgi:uncharacterized protein YbcI
MEVDMPSNPAAGSGIAEVGGELLTRISNEMVHAQKKFFGKGPTSAKSYMLDDMLLIVMRGGFTTAERTMLEFGQQDLVRQFRQIFENEMTDRLQQMIQDLTGRKVLTYQSQILFEPDVVIEIFLFDSEGGKGTVEATARGLLADDDSGEAINTTDVQNETSERAAD